MTQDVIGVKCGICHEETFRVLKRDARLVVDCCLRCASRIDLEQEEQTTKEALRRMNRAERKLFLREKSFEWANKLHGKPVIIYWDDYAHPIFSTPESKYSALGIAFRTVDISGGWGQIQVVLSEKEHYRISFQEDYFWKQNKRVWYQRPIIDRQRYGLILNKGKDGSYYAFVSWGSRRCVVLDGGSENGKEAIDMRMRVEVDQTRKDIRKTFRKWGIDPSEFEILWEQELDKQRKGTGAIVRYFRNSTWQEVACYGFPNRAQNLRQCFLLLDRLRIAEQQGVRYQGLTYTKEMVATVDTEALRKESLLDAYDVLGVSPDDPVDLVQDIYRRKSLRYHPDKGGDPEKFKRLTQAYELIMKSRGQVP